MQTYATLQKETQINGCLHYAIPCAYIFMCGCCCCGSQTCMKWCALNMNEGQRQPNCFCDDLGCASRGSTIHVVCGDVLFYCYFAFVLLCALHLLVCVRTLREGCRHDGPLSPYVDAVEPCVPLPLPSLSLSHLCVGVAAGLCVCVCLLPWIGVCVVRGVRRAVHAWLLPSPHVVCPLCVCLSHLSSPLLLSMSLTVQISSTPLNDHTHDDDDVPFAVRPVGARPVLLPVRVRFRFSESSSSFPKHHDDHNRITAG
ncbi:hypothetical protein ECC02_008236 [Trypanosoma cruzi]|uniref:Mucin TcMUC n=1 Tax=Trypanosoma cruzi TaxID=5693 RepID=A0A7J6XX70_TRYCR|nr:hypothetical protein ECC02_008236 [Trypanosoma cruzi]